MIYNAFTLRSIARRECKKVSRQAECRGGLSPEGLG